ncbi:hypothetical protein D3C79_626680 [compost metagenome]
MDWGAVRFWVGVPEVYDVIAISPHTNAGCASGGHLLLVMTPRSFSGGRLANLNANAVPKLERPSKKT